MRSSWVSLDCSTANKGLAVQGRDNAKSRHGLDGVGKARRSGVGVEGDTEMTSARLLLRPSERQQRAPSVARLRVRSVSARADI